MLIYLKKVSGVRFQVSGVRFQVLGFRDNKKECFDLHGELQGQSTYDIKGSGKFHN